MPGDPSFPESSSVCSLPSTGSGTGNPSSSSSSSSSKTPGVSGRPSIGSGSLSEPSDEVEDGDDEFETEIKRN